MTDRQEQINNVLKCLDTALMADLGAIHSLLCVRVPTNQALLDHPHIVVNNHVYISVGVLGLINGILTSAGLPRIAMKWEEKKFDEKDEVTHIFTGFMLAPADAQPPEMAEETEQDLLLAKLEEAVKGPGALHGVEQALWHILGIITRSSENIDNRFAGIAAAMEEYFGVGNGVSDVDARAALAELVATKDMVDTQGKTPEYEARREAAWAQARKVLSNTEATNKVATTVPDPEVNFIFIDGDPNLSINPIFTKPRDEQFLTPRQYGSGRGHLKSMLADLDHMKHYVKDDPSLLRLVGEIGDDLNKLKMVVDKLIEHTTPKEG